jgi:hypothetical protein
MMSFLRNGGDVHHGKGIDHGAPFTCRYQNTQKHYTPIWDHCFTVAPLVLVGTKEQ